MVETSEFPQEYNLVDGPRLKEQGIAKIGIALFIVDLDTKKLWTVRESENKESTGREAGTLTVPLETRKITGRGRLEFMDENVFGCLDEFRKLQEEEELVSER